MEYIDPIIFNISTLMQEIDRVFPYSTDRSNYGQILRDVANKTNVHDIIKDVVTIVNGISKVPYGLSDCKSILYGYMNECIAKVYEESDESSTDGFCEAYINIRENRNCDTIRERIMDIAKNKGIEVEKTKEDIQKALNEFKQNLNLLNRFERDSNGYNQYLPLCKNSAAILLQYKFIPYGVESGRDIFTEVEYDKQRARAKEKRERIFKREYRIETICIIISAIVCLAVLIAIMASCAGI